MVLILFHGGCDTPQYSYTLLFTLNKKNIRVWPSEVNKNISIISRYTKPDID